MTNDYLHTLNQGRPLSSAATPATQQTINDCTYSEERPCEKYRQFMDSSRQERTFMIEKLVETFANVIDSIWHPKFLIEHQKAKVMPTKGFCNEILKRSKATYSTVQISLFYVFRVKKVVHEKLYQRIQSNSCNMQTNTQMDDLQCCGRRMFLASLMVASKYLHDKNYHNKAWAKITGLDIKEINAAEMAFLKLIDYRLHVSKPTFDRWYTQLHGHIQKGFKHTMNKPMVNTPPTVCQSPSSVINTNAVHHAMIHQNYPSPPPDESSLTSPPTMETKPACYQRTDSGVSFDILSPPSSQHTGTKRSFDQDEATCFAKRLCQ